jgi:hypothetical protein
LALLLLVAGSAYSVLLPAATSMSYQPRQLLPFAAAVVAIAVRGGLDVWDTIFAAATIDPNIGRWVKARFVLMITVGFAAIAMISVRYAPEMNNAAAPAQKIAMQLAQMQTQYPKVVFNIGGFPQGQRPYVQGYPEVLPELEYLTGSLVLSFENPNDLLTDLRRLLALSKVPFSPVFLVKNHAQLDAIKRDAKIPGCVAAIAPVSVGQSLVLNITETKPCW